MVAILVVLTIITCITVDVLIQWSRARRPQAQLAGGSARLPFTPARVSVPAGIFMDPAHTWVEISANGGTRVGLDDFIVKAIGRIDEVILPKVGQEVHQGEPLFTVRQGERKIDFPAPVDGVVNAVNENLTVAPELTKAAPYRQGWVCGVAPKCLAKTVKQLSIAEEALSWIKSEVERFQQFISARPLTDIAMGTVLQDGGLPTCGALEFMDDETWNLFASEFVHTRSQH